MFKKFTSGCVSVVNRWLPDPFLFAVILTMVVFVAALFGTGMKPDELVTAWGDSKGFWNLLAFAMQMALVLVLGSAMASAKICKKALGGLASFAHNKMQAILMVTFVSTLCCWLNWGFGLIVGALLAKEIAKKVENVDYPLLIASAYSGFVIWHAGLSGSIPLTFAGGYVLPDGTVIEAVSTKLTLFHPINIILCLVILVTMPLINYAMHPSEKNTIRVNPELLVDENEKVYTKDTPAEKIEQSKILWGLIVLLGVSYIGIYFANGNKLNLNIVNMIFLFAGVLLHGNLRKYVDAIAESAKGAAGIILQFPFYAGIMGLMVVSNESGISLATIIADFFVSISTDVTFPVWTFLSAGIINFFVPSGGGQMAVQAPIVIPAAQQLGVDIGRAAMAIAWGDQWTNMIQPFWALPALGIAGLSARNVMGYLVVILLYVGLIACLGFVAWGLLF